MRSDEIKKEEIRSKLHDVLKSILEQARLGKAISEIEVLRKERDCSMDAVYAMFYAHRKKKEVSKDFWTDEEIDEMLNYDDEDDDDYDGNEEDLEPHGLSLPIDLLKSIAQHGYTVGPHGGSLDINISENINLNVRIKSPCRPEDVQYVLKADCTAFSISSQPLYARQALTGATFDALLRVIRQDKGRLMAEIDEMAQEVLVARQERRLFETALPHFVKTFGRDNNMQYTIDFDSTDFDSDAVMQVRLTHNKCVVFPLSLDAFNEEFERIVPVVKELCDIHRKISSEFSLESEYAVADRMDRLESRCRQSKASVTFTAATSFVTSDSPFNATTPMALLRAIMVELDTMGIDYQCSNNALELYLGNFKVAFEARESERAATFTVDYLNPYREMRRVNILPPSQCIAGPFAHFVRDLISEMPDLDATLHDLLENEDKKHKGYNEFMRRVRALVGEHVFGYDFSHLLVFDAAPTCVGYLSMEIGEGLYVTVRLSPTNCDRRIKSLVDVCTRMDKLHTDSGIQFEYKTCNKYVKWQKAV